MKFALLENTPNIVRFTLSGVSFSFNFANAIRRVAISSVDTFAVDSVTFYENSSAMFDEYVAHRIGLIPLVTPQGYTEKDEILFTLSVEGPATVYSKDLKSNDKEVKVANQNIPIMKLGEGQVLRLDAKAVMNKGSKSSKFQPGIITYKANDGGTEFEFYVESFGQMPAIEIMARTLNVISDNLKEVHKELKK